MPDPLAIEYDWIQKGELENALLIEQQGYPGDEAATLDAFKYRQCNAPRLFLGAYLRKVSAHAGPRELIGYVCSTLASGAHLTKASMSAHDPAGASVCIHSVCVAPQYRRRGVGLAMLREYVRRLEAEAEAVEDAATQAEVPPEAAQYERILLITHENLRPFYERAGFAWVGKSPVEHGSEPWFEMVRVLPGAASSTSASVPPAILDSEAQKRSELAHNLPPAQVNPESSSAAPPFSAMPAGLWEALSASSSRPRPVAKPLSAFPGGVLDVVEGASDEGTGAAKAGASSQNKYDLLCPRAGCGSVILKRGVAKWVERASVQMEPDDYPSRAVLAQLPRPPETTHWWLVTPSPMQFENVGFSKPVQPQSQSGSGPKMKLLACAECDLGPLGWCAEGGSEFWLACARVGYRA